MQFRDLCRRSPPPNVPQLPLPAPNPDKAREVMSLLRTAVRRAEDRLGWARELQRREEAGEPLTKAQRQAWREALLEQAESVLIGSFSSPAPEALPMAMRQLTN